MNWHLFGFLWAELQQGEISESLSRLEEEEGGKDCHRPAWELEERSDVQSSLFG